MTEQAAQLRLSTCYRGPMPGAVNCTGHPDCRIETERRREQHAQITALTAENAQLRKDLQKEWEWNHSEHCSNEWPHPEGRVCYWRPPVSLAGSARP